MVDFFNRQSTIQKVAPILLFTVYSLQFTVYCSRFFRSSQKRDMFSDVIANELIMELLLSIEGIVQFLTEHTILHHKPVNNMNQLPGFR